MQKKKRLMVIGIDGGSWKAFDKLFSDGTMNRLSEMREKGLWSVCNSVHPPVSPPAWASFMTGKNPGKHGIFDFQHYARSENKLYFVNSTLIRSKTLWEILSEEGKRVCVLNVPMTFPPYKINGIMVSGFDMPNLDSKFTYPENLRDEILLSVPNYQLVPNEINVKDEKSLNVLCEQVIECLEQRIKLGTQVLKKEAWDVFMLNFQAIDWLQHRTWGLLEKYISNDISSRYIDTVKSCYEKLDQCLEYLFDYAKHEHMDIMIVSDHGFGPGYGTIFINRILIEMGLLGKKNITMTGDNDINILKKTAYKLPWIGNKIKELRQIYWGAKSYRQKGNRWIETLYKTSGNKSFLEDYEGDWLCALSYAYGFLYRNNNNKKNENIMTDEMLVEKLFALKDPINKMPLFMDIKKSVDLYSFDSDILSNAPDLVAIPQPWLKVSKSISDEIARWSISWEGEHYKDGIFLYLPSHNNGINGKHDTVSLMDIAPTILSMLNIPIPEDMDGKPINWVTGSKHYKISKKSYKETSEYDFKDDEQEEIAKRLSELGYI